MTMYSKNEAYPITRAKFPLQIIDGGGISYTNEHAFNNRQFFGWTDVSDIPEYNYTTHNIAWKYNKRAQTFWEVTEKTDEEKDAETISKWEPHRSNRNQLLNDSDWSQIKRSDTEYGVPGNVIDTHQRINWEVYRQKLRDLPATQTLSNITWPNTPS